MALTIKEAVRKWGPEYLTICGLVKYFPTMNYNSHVFFVNGTSTIGDDGVNTGGQVPDEPFLTITKAISECTDGANDYIFVLDYPSTAPATETFPIAINKQRVHILGVLNGRIPRFKIVAPTDTAVFSFGLTGSTYGAYSELANFIMGSAASSAKGAIEFFQAGCFGIHIHHCGFGLAARSNTDCKYGICIGKTGTENAGELIYGLIEHCTFGELVSSDGIYVPNVPYTGPNSIYSLIIRNNYFKVDGIGINIDHAAANMHEGGIYNNRFCMSSDAVGKAIDIVAGVTGGFIDGNVASVLANEASVSANPYRTMTACGPAWGLNYKGSSELAVAPALA